MSDSLTTYTLQVRQTQPPSGQAISDDTGWALSSTSPHPAANATTATDSTSPQVWYRLKQTTANGVVVPFTIATLAPAPVANFALNGINTGPPGYQSDLNWTFPNFSLMPLLRNMGTVSMQLQRFMLQRSPDNIDTPFSITGQGTTNASGLDPTSYSIPPADPNWTDVVFVEYQGQTGFEVATGYGIGPAPSQYPFTTGVVDLVTPNRVMHYRLIAMLHIGSQYYELDWRVIYTTKAFILALSTNGSQISLSWT